MSGLRHTSGATACAPYSRGPYIWDQHVTFSAGLSGANTNGNIMYVDSTNGSTGGDGTSWSKAFNTIQLGVTAAGPNGIVYVMPKAITDFTGDPANYAETIIIPATHFGLSIIGISTGRVQGGMPQVKKGSGSTALLTVRAAGCLIANMGFNGSGSTGGGILLDDDNSTKTAFGTTITNCHIKNCRGSSATDGRTGGGIMWASVGNAWQVNITNNKFYKNVSDICLIGTTNTRPQDILIQGNIFQSSVTSTCDVNIWGSGTGSGFQCIYILDNYFGDLPALGSGSVTRYMDMTGTLEGFVAGNVFGCMTANTGTTITFQASGTGAKIPTTMHVANNYGQSDTATESGEINIA